MSDTEWDEEEIPPPPCPVEAGPGSITHSSRLPAELEEVSNILAPMEDPVNWFGRGAEELRRLAWIALTTSDSEPDTRHAEIIGPLYLNWRDLVPRTHRAFFIDQLAQAVAGGKCIPHSLALLMWLEDEPLLIARAAAAYVDAEGMIDHDPVPAADGLLACWTDADSEHRAGFFLGLMLLGDPAILEGLREFRYELTDDEVAMVCGATISGPYDTMVDFQLEWLEEVQAEGDHGKFVMLATSITPIGPEDRKNEGEAEAADWRRLTPPGSDSEIPDHWYFPVGRRAMGRHHGPRLQALARREVGTRVMPAVLEAYGLDIDNEAS